MKKNFTKLKKWAIALAALSISATGFAQRVNTFEELTLQEDSKYIGAETETGFQSGNVFFPNSYSYDETYGAFWSGWAYSNQKDVTDGDYTNDCSSYAGGGNNGSKNFAVMFGSGKRLHLTGSSKGAALKGFYITNNTYAALTMKNGSQFSAKFGGQDGTAADSFRVSINAYYNGVKTAKPVNFFLADFRFADDSKDYIVKDWTYVDLSSLGYADSLEFTFASSDNGQWGMNTPAYFCMDDFKVVPAPFAGPVGAANTSAIKADDAKFVSWAQTASVTRGLQQIDKTAGAYASVGDESSAIGNPDGNVLSLGDGGSAIVTFKKPVANGPGADFAVFENAFAKAGSTTLFFLELGFVEVSSDGQNFFRFPATSYTDTTVQIGGFGYIDPKSVNNLAGKYQSNYGTPFDLEELKGIAGLDVNNITHVKIIDVVGAINPLYASRDQYKQIVNDPWATPFASGGFDLDAVGVINESTTTNLTDATLAESVLVYPNPARSGETVTIANISGNVSYTLLNGVGETVSEGNSAQVSLAGLNTGLYFLNITSDEVQVKGKKLIVK